jgi:hypothetical protein
LKNTIKSQKINFLYGSLQKASILMLAKFLSTPSLIEKKTYWKFGEIPLRNLKKNLEKAYYLYESLKKSSIQSHQIYRIIIFLIKLDDDKNFEHQDWSLLATIQKFDFLWFYCVFQAFLVEMFKKALCFWKYQCTIYENNEEKAY